MATFKVSNRWGGGSLKSLNAKTSTGVGDVFDLRSGWQNFGIQCDVAGSTSVKVILEGSLRSTASTAFKTVGSTNGWRLSAQGDNGLVAVASTMPCRYVRLRLVTMTTSAGADSVDGWIGVS